MAFIDSDFRKMNTQKVTARTPQTVKSFRQAHTNTSKSSTFMPLSHPPLRQAPRIPQSSKFLCLFLTRPSGRLYEYFKVPVFYASSPPAALAGHSNTSKPLTFMPLPHLPLRQAIRILQSSWFLCLFLACRSGRPHEYLKVPSSYASSSPAALASPTNTSKLRFLMPLPRLPLRQAARILQSFQSHMPQSVLPKPAGHSNTKKVKAQVPPPFRSNRQA